MAKAFIPFIMAGHPNLNATREAILALAALNADYIELGVPFSDPVADGVVNQMAAEVALKQGVRLHDVLALVNSLRKEGLKTPILLFSYLNPIMALGYESFIKAAKDSGINGVLIVDLPPEEGESFFLQLRKAGIGVVLLISPTTNPSRYPAYQALDPLFIYYISRRSVTGMQTELSPELASEVRNVRAHFKNKKIMVGFGISTPEQAKTVAQFADGVIVGSILVKTLHQQGMEAFKMLAAEFADVLSLADG